MLLFLSILKFDTFLSAFLAKTFDLFYDLPYYSSLSVSVFTILKLGWRLRSNNLISFVFWFFSFYSLCDPLLEICPEWKQETRGDNTFLELIEFTDNFWITWDYGQLSLLLFTIWAFVIAMFGEYGASFALLVSE